MANGDVSHRGAPFLVEKIVVLGMTSGGLGALFGVLAGGAMGLGFMAAVCAALGAGLGLLMSPLFIWGMWAQRGCMCVLLVALVTGLAAILAGLAMRPNDGPLFQSSFRQWCTAGSVLSSGSGRERRGSLTLRDVRRAGTCWRGWTQRCVRSAVMSSSELRHLATTGVEVYFCRNARSARVYQR